MLIPTRNYQNPEYRYGFQGQEKDDEIKGNANSINYKFRMHDPRVGRFFAVDPLAEKYPYYTPYSFSGNKVINAVELEGLEEQIIHVQYLGDKKYKTVLKKSQFTYVEWKQLQKAYWKSIIIDNQRTIDNFGGLGYYDYLKDPSNSGPRLDLNKNRWHGNDKGTLLVSDYHGMMTYGFNKTDVGIGSYKTSTATLDQITDLVSNIEIAASGSIVATGGASAPIAIPLIKLTEAIGKVATVEKGIIEAINGDVGKSIKTFSGGFVIPRGVEKLFDKWRGKTLTKRGMDRINFIETLVNEAISKGLDYIEVPLENTPTTTVEKNTKF